MTETARIVVGVGDIDDGMRPLIWAVGEARRRGVQLHAVRVWRHRTWLDPTTGLCWSNHLAEEARQYLIETINAALGGIPHDVAVRMVVREGLVADALLAYADREDDLLVLGASPRGWPWPWGDGTVRRCVQRARCAVTVVPKVTYDRKVLRQLRRELRELENLNR
jgi:nucleotide-binding universal stress UspA family protein